MTRLSAIIATLAVIVMAMGYGVPAFAAFEVTRVADIRAATNFASQKGFCKPTTDPTSADCKKQTTYCDSEDWSAFVKANVVYQGGIPTQLKGSGITGAAATALTGISGYQLSGPILDGELLPTEVYTYLRKDPKNASSIPSLSEAACFCDCAPGDSDPSCKGLAAGTPVRFGGDRLYTREECAATCVGRSVTGKCAGNLPIIETIDSSSAAGQAAADAAQRATDVRMMCFTKDACAKADGVWEAYIGCSESEGRCIALEPELKLNTALGNTVSVRGFNQYVVAAYRYMLSVAIIIATIMFIAGGFVYLLGASGATSISKGKSMMLDSIIGLILLFSATAILRTLNPALITLSPIKVYMVNTQNFISTAYCKDLVDTSLRLADAGEPPTLTPYDEIAKKDDAFSVTPDQAACGHQYYVQNASGGSCAGTGCPNPAEVCTSCASGQPTPCQKIKSTRMVCDKQVFAGTIEYQDSRYPESVYLFLMCNDGQSDGVDALQTTQSNVSIVKVNLNQIAKTSGTAQSDATAIGQSMYRFDFSKDDITKMDAFCAGKGGFRGALLGVQYNTSVVNIDSFALLSRKNCSGAKEFDGYSDGSFTSDILPLAEAFHCGKNKNPSRFINPQQDYWSEAELIAAAEGRQAIPCNFVLNNTSAPHSPETTEPYCPVSTMRANQANLESQASADACASLPQCASGLASGTICTSGSPRCCTPANAQCSCVPLGAQGAGNIWRCQ